MRSMVPDRAKRSERPAWVREGRLAYTSAPTGHRLCGPRYIWGGKGGGPAMDRVSGMMESPAPQTWHAPCR